MPGESDSDRDGVWSLPSQGRMLCQLYIIQRSLKAGAQLRKVRMLFGGCSSQISDTLSEKLLEIVNTMEELHPGVYDTCSAKLKITMSTDEQVRWAYSKITEQLLKTGITWGKLISIFTVCGALASDCVSQGHTNYLPIIVDCFEETLTETTAHQFLKDFGGWTAVTDHYYNKLQPIESTQSHLDLKVSLLNKLTYKSVEKIQELAKLLDIWTVMIFIAVFGALILTYSRLFKVK